MARSMWLSTRILLLPRPASGSSAAAASGLGWLVRTRQHQAAWFDVELDQIPVQTLRVAFMPAVCFADTETDARMANGAHRSGATLIRESQRYTRRLEDIAAADPPINLP